MPKVADHWTWSQMTFANWRHAVDHRLKAVYLITLDDAGISDEYLKPHWESKEAPNNFVEWFALKYDLDPKSAFWL
jgi:hypothetical protein